MYPKVYRKEITLPDGRVISIETGKLAKQANGSVVVQMGNTMLLATATMMPEPREGADFLPLSVDYQEKFSAAGKIPGGFNKREGRLGDHEILISRLVDRAIRPMFPEGYFLETQINIFLISADATAVPDCLAALAASSAMMVSDIPFPEPVSEVRVARKDGQFHINPTPEYINGADLDLIVAATHDNIMMVEGQMNEAQEEDILEALKVAHEAIKVQCQAQVELMHEAGKTEKYDFPRLLEDDEDLKKMVFDAVYDKFYDVAKGKHDNKNVRKEKFGAVKKEFKESLPEEHGYNPDLISKYLKAAEKKAARDMVLNEGYRLDGRGTEEIRDIWGEISYLPAAHGSAVFTRGETQSLTTVTLGTKLDEQMIDQTMEKGTRKFILHYNFPGFSTGEVKPNRGPGRREVGHGNLAWRALSKAMPSQDDNPYTVRIVSDILESNGSSSMATVCAGSMALMDAGISVKGAVSGIAMGMISDPETGKYAILSDILGDEDHLGDMDFKVTGTANGVTACQMDIKIDGLSYEVLSKALSQSKRGRMHILGKMNEVISVPREDFKENAPRFEKIRIKSDQIGAVIGPGGKIVQEIQKSTGATVVIEEEGNHGVVSVFAQEKKAMEQAVKMIKEIVSEPEVGGTYNGKVKSVTTFGAFIEFMKGKEGLLHISEITWERLPSMDGVIEVGEEVTIKLIEVDEKTGKYRLSRKVLLPKPEGYVDSPASSGRDRRDRGDRNDRGDRRDRGGDRGDRRRPDKN